jgi:hypothetical protein
MIKLVNENKTIIGNIDDYDGILQAMDYSKGLDGDYHTIYTKTFNLPKNTEVKVYITPNHDYQIVDAIATDLDTGHTYRLPRNFFKTYATIRDVTDDIWNIEKAVKNFDADDYIVSTMRRSGAPNFKRYSEGRKRGRRSMVIKAGSRVTDSKEWFDMWFEDKKSIISIMYSNMASDLAAGYDYFGKSIQDQKQEIAKYEAEFERQLDKFKSMSDDEVNRWCFYDMKKRGAIE